MSLRTCSFFYTLLLLLNISFYVVLYLNVPFQTSNQAVTCNCPHSVSVNNQKYVLPDNQQVLSQDKIPHTKSRHYLLVVLILSSLEGRRRRDSIRQTWMKGYKEKELGVLVQFAIGIKDLLTSDMEALSSEQTTHGDLLLLSDLQESYFSLTKKVLLSFKTVDANINFSYLLKCDDDTFVILDTILKELAQRTSKQSYYWGFFDGRAHVKRKGKWTEKKWFLCDRYLPYALGGGYILSHDLVKRIVSNSDSLILYNSEDVSVGAWLSPYEAERRHDVRFNTEFVSRGCRNQYVVSHKQSIKDMISKQGLLEEKGKQCDKEYQTRLSYVYNWTVEPTKCCERKKNIA